MRPQDLQPGDFPVYYNSYIANLEQKDLLSLFQDQMEVMAAFLSRLMPEDLRISYAPGKWSVAQVLQHMLDTERIFQYRALRIARNDSSPLAGYDQDAYVPSSGAHTRDLDSFKKEFIAVRQSGICLFESFDAPMLLRKGISNGEPLSAAAAGFIIAGHENHHQLLFKSNYKL